MLLGTQKNARLCQRPVETSTHSASTLNFVERKMKRHGAAIRLPDSTDEFLPRESHDPLQRVRDEAPAFNRVWMKNGESLSLVQRVGFTIFSLVFCLGGAWMLQGAVEEFHEGSFASIFFVLGSIPLVIPGILGLRNVLRFDRSSPSE